MTALQESLNAIQEDAYTRASYNYDWIKPCAIWLTS